MKLNPFENSRSFYSRSKGTTKTVRDTYTKQTNPKIEEVKKVNKPKVKKEEPKIEIKMSGVQNNYEHRCGLAKRVNMIMEISVGVGSV